MKLLRSIKNRVFPPKCRCRIQNKWPYVRSTIRECPLHGERRWQELTDHRDHPWLK